MGRTVDQGTNHSESIEQGCDQGPFSTAGGLVTCFLTHDDMLFEQVCLLWLFCSYLTMLGALVWGEGLKTWLVFVVLVFQSPDILE